MIVTQDESRSVFEGDLFVEDGIITERGKSSDTSDLVIDAGGGLVLPGLINTHTHVAMTGFRGLLDDMNLEPFLEKTFKLDSKRTDEDITTTASLSLREMISGGTTAFVDLYYSEDLIAEVCKRYGMRGFLAWVTLDREITTQKGDPVSNAESFAKRWKSDGLVTPMIGMQGVYVCSEETSMSAKQVAERLGLGMHMHLSETRQEVYGHVAKTGSRPVEWLKKIGLLDGNSRLLAAHGAWLTKSEISILKNAEVGISSCARSNMKLGSGIPPVRELVEEGVTVSLGTDSATTSNNLDMFEEMRFASLLQKVDKWDASVIPAQTALDMVTRNAASSLGRMASLGSLEAGKSADIVILDRNSPRLSPLSRVNAVSQVVYSAEAGDVTHTVINGRVVYGGRKFQQDGS